MRRMVERKYKRLAEKLAAALAKSPILGEREEDYKEVLKALRAFEGHITVPILPMKKNERTSGMKSRMTSHLHVMIEPGIKKQAQEFGVDISHAARDGINKAILKRMKQLERKFLKNRKKQND